jgi:peptide/nickel transport system permease protein
MWQYILKRVLLMIPTLLGAALLVFLLMHVVPGDIALLIVGGDQAGEINAQEVIKVREQLGLNRPLPVQFLSWLWRAAHLDFGTSLWTGAPVSEELWVRLPVTVEVALGATLVSGLLAVPLGMLAAIRQDTWPDYVVRVVSIGGLAVPSFWIGILIILFLVLWFQWSPPLEFVSPLADPWENVQQLVWPIVSVGYRYAAVTTRMTRSTMLEVLREDYVRTAWAKGLHERVVVLKHTLKNAMLPVITIIGTEFAFLIGGLVVTETVFTLNGVGRFMVDAIAHRDIPVVQALALLTALVFVVINLLVDVLYGWLDPRVSYR